MVTDRFNMVDMGGIDIISSQGIEVPGLYDLLVVSISRCRYTMLYNWFFDGILIPPSQVELTVEDNTVSINGGIVVDSSDTVHIYSLIPEPVIIPLTVSQNGTYEIPENADGYGPVTVEVPLPVIASITIEENGIYSAPSGVDGYSPITVDVQPPRYAATHVWTHSIGGNDASIDVQEGYYQNGVFTPTGEIVNVIYTTVQGTTVRTFDQLTLGYPSGWVVTALENISYSGGQLVTGGTVTWSYNQSRDYIFYSTEVIH